MCYGDLLSVIFYVTITKKYITYNLLKAQMMVRIFQQ